MKAIDLDAELLRAMALARDAKVVAMMASLDLPETSMQWGFARVDFYGFNDKLYEPQDDGAHMAFVIPVVEGGELIDLAAVDGMNEHLAQRLGHGRAFGVDAIAKARFGCCDLHLVERPLGWLRKQDLVLREIVAFAREVDDLTGGDFIRPRRAELPSDYAYLFDLSQAPDMLEGVREFTVAPFEFYERVRVLFPPSERARVLGPP